MAGLEPGRTKLVVVSQLFSGQEAVQIPGSSSRLLDMGLHPWFLLLGQPSPLRMGKHGLTLLGVVLRPHFTDPKKSL